MTRPGCGPRGRAGSGRARPGEDSAAWERLRAAGAILLGKTNTHEWAYGTTGINPHYGPARNPWDPERVTGGSSSGSGAAIVADLCAAALGSDTGRLDPDAGRSVRPRRDQADLRPGQPLRDRSRSRGRSTIPGR